MKHTPGPWEISRGVHAYPFSIESESKTIGFIKLQTGLQEVTEANARLIASAPDLLEACKEILNLLEAEMPIWYLRYHYNVLSSAIAKATGNTATHTTSSVIEA